MKEQFIWKNFRESSLAIIATANEIIERYQAAGFRLTVRQLYYQFVSHYDYVLDPEAVAQGRTVNTERNYKRLTSIIDDARLAGLIDWDAIEDRTRNLQTHNAWDSPESIVGACAEQYAEDLWRSQDAHCEVWIEKDALLGVIEAVCKRWRVPYFACRGYNSQSEQYRAGKRFDAARRRGKELILLHLGDHDPSGLDMTRDNRDRLQLLSRGDIGVRRLALNMDQVRAYNPPPNPAKPTDARFEEYRRAWGDECWELDALDPEVIDGVIDTELQAIINHDQWEEAKAEEERNKALLGRVADQWDDVIARLDD